MRILILTNKDLASNLAVKLLLDAVPQHHFSILMSAKVGSAKNLAPQLTELAFFEQSLFNDIVAPICHKLIQEKQPYLDSFDALQQKGIEVSMIEHINHADGVKSVTRLEPDLIVSIRFGQIIQPSIIALPKYGVINLHSGLLPDYRGVMATFWAMLHKQEEFGTTLHFIDSNQIDAGQIISTAKSKIDYSKSYLFNVLSLYPQGVMQIVDAINTIEQEQTLQSVPMDINKGNYFSLPDKQSLNQFAAQGNRLIDYAEIIAFAKWYYQPQ